MSMEIPKALQEIAADPEHQSMGMEVIALKAELAQVKAELAKCGKENCMGHEVEGCRSWVSKEALDRREADYQAHLKQCCMDMARWESALAASQKELAMCQEENRQLRFWETDMRETSARHANDLEELTEALAASQAEAKELRAALRKLVAVINSVSELDDNILYLNGRYCGAMQVPFDEAESVLKRGEGQNGD